LLKHRNGAKLVKKDNKLIAELQQKDLFAIRAFMLAHKLWSFYACPQALVFYACLQT
jgi:hypothetical protein